MYIDLHCDTLTARPDVAHGEGQVSFDKLKKASCAAQCFAIFLDKAEGPLWPRYETYRARLDDLLTQNHLSLALCPADVEAALRAGKFAPILAVEGGDLLGGDVQNLYRLHRQGVRLLTLTWNYPNALGYPNIDLSARPQNICAVASRGLTPFGREVVDAMNRLGMMIDVSHLSDGGFWDVLRYSSSPVLASHSNARRICSVARNLSDEMILALAKKGGVMGLCFCYDFLTESGGEIEDLYVAHARHVYQVGGEDVLAVGSDFDGIPVVEGCDCTILPRLFDKLARVLPQRVVDKMMWCNALRVWRDVWENAQKLF